MGALWQIDESLLRRKLLFRLLKGFDFDKPIFRHEPITAPIQKTSFLEEFMEDRDAFDFTFQ